MRACPVINTGLEIRPAICDLKGMVFAGDKKEGTWLLATAESRLRDALLPLVPRWCETYHLTMLTVLWCILILGCSYIAQFNGYSWSMHLVSVWIFLQYITDLLDGAIGRTRNTGLIKWGYYMDHFLDYLFLCSILIGYSFLIAAPYKIMLFFILALFGAFMVNSFLSFAATNQFKIAYLGVGPTEIRVGFIFVNCFLAHNSTFLAPALPYVLAGSLFGLFVTVFRTQQMLWKLDMQIKAERDDPQESGA